MSQIKPGDQVWIPAVADHPAHTDPSALWVWYDGKLVRRTDAYWFPDHPALPAISKLLHEEPGLADAVQDVLIHGGMADPPHIHSVIRLAAALVTKEDRDGTNG